MTEYATVWLDMVGSRARRLSSCRLPGSQTLRWFQSGADAIAFAREQGAPAVLLWVKGLPVLLDLTPRPELADTADDIGGINPPTEEAAGHG